MANGTFNLNVKAKADLTELSKLKSELQNIRTLAKDIDFTGDLDPNEINAMTNAALQLEKALDAAFDVNLNTVSIQKFNDYLRKSGLSLKDIQADLAKAGAVGQQAFINTTANVLQMNIALRKSNEFLDKMATTMANTVRWSITSSILNAVVGSVEQAIYYIKDLDIGLNDIRIVTGKSADEMARFAVEANNAAKALAVSTLDYTEGSLIYYQQGLDDETVKTLTDITAKTSNVTGQSMRTVSEQLTAVWNGYQVANEAAMEGMQVYEEYVDKMAAVGAATASDLEELATAMSKVASAANVMGVDFDQLSAQIATIVSVTRQAPESVGTALKTIYARLGDLKVDGVDEFGVTLGEVSSILDQVGIKIVDQSGEMREMGTVMEEVAVKWDTWNGAQKQAIAIAMAGKRQYNNLLSLFENWDMYTETLNTAAGAAGTLDEQQNTALESLANKMDVLRATAEDLYDNLFDEESMIGLVDRFTTLVQVIADVTDALGGLKNILPLIGSLGVQVFSKQITNAIVGFKTNLNITRNEAEKTAQSIAALQELFPTIDFVTSSGDTATSLNKGVNDLIQYYTKYSELRQYMSADDKKIFNNILNQKAALANMNIELDEQIENWKQSIESAQVFQVKISKTKDGWRGLEKLKTVTSEYNSELSKLNTKLITVERKYNNLNEHTKAVNSAFTTFFNTLKSKGNFNEAGIESLRVKIKGMIDEAAQKGNLDGTKLQELLNILKQYSKSGGDIANVIKQIDALEGRINSLDEGFASKIDFQKLTNGIVNTVSAFGQLASAWQTVQNLGDIWSDETLTDGEKFAQILINISFVLPTLLDSLKMLNTTFKLTTVLTKGWAVAKAAATKGLGLMTAAQYGLNAAMRDNPVGFFITAITALVGIIGIAVKAFDAIHVSAEEASEALSESIDKYKNTESELNSLNNELDTTTNRLKELYAIADEDLTIADKQEIARLEAQNAALAAQIELKKEQLDLDQKEIIKKEKQSIEKGNFNSQDGVDRIYGGGTAGSTTYDFTGSDEEYQKVLSEIENASSTGVFYRQYKTVTGNWATDTSKSYNKKDLLKYAETERQAYLDNVNQNYQTAVEDGLLQAYYSQNIDGQYNEEIEKLEKAVLEYYEAHGRLGSVVENILNASFDSNEQLNAILDDSNNILNDENKTINKENFIAALNEMGMTGEDVYNDLLISSQTLGISMYDLINAAEKYNVQIFNSETKNSLYDVSLEKVNLLTDALDKLRKGTELTEEEISKIEGKYGELSKIWDKTSYDYIQALNQILEMEEEAVTKQLKENVGLAWADAIKAVKKYNSILEETNYVEPEISGGIKQIPLEDAEYYVDLGLKKESIEEIDKALKELFNTQYNLEVSITDDLLTDAENLVTTIENVATATSLIGEGFKVAAEDADKLFSIYPELASQAQILADGTIQLKENVVTATLDGYADIIDKDKEVTAQNIQDRIQELEAKKVTVKGQIEAVQNSTDIQTDLNKILGDNSEGWMKYEAELNADLATDEVFNSGKSAEAIIQNWAEKEKAAMDYAATAAEAEAAGHKTNGPRVKGSNYNVRTEAETQNTTEENSSDDVIAQTEEELRQNVLDYLNNLYDSYESQIADLTVLYSGIFSSKDKIGKDDKKEEKINPKDVKDYADEFDRYWTINKAIEKVTESLSDLDKVQSHLFGKELIASLEKENKLLEEQTDKYKKLYEMQIDEAGELQWTLQQFGVTFNAEGGIDNYAAITQKMLNAYNSSSITDEQYEKFKDALERYEEVYYEEIVDTQNKLTDIYYEQLANNIEAWETEIELNLEFEEAEREWSDFMKEISNDFKATYRDISKDFTHLFEQIGSYSKKDGTIATDIKALNDAEAELLRIQAHGSSDMFASVSEAEERVKELKQTLMEDVEAVHGLWVDAWDAYMEGIDQASDKFDDLMSKFDAIDEELEYQGELIELLYGTQAYSLMDSLYDAQLNNSLAQVNSLRQQANMWEELYNNAEEGSEEQTKYYEKWQEAQTNLNDLVIEHINLLKKDYNNTLDSILNNLEKSVTGGLGLDKMRENWEESTAAADKYFDATERIYELETLENKFQSAIGETTSIKNQQKLKKLMDEQIKDLEAKEKLTEYDVTLAEKRLAIAQAEMALEDAQNSKNAMKLTRGASGNWEYQYVADESDVAEKQQQMLDAYNNLYQHVKDTQEKSVESIINMTEQFFTKMNEIRNNDTLSEEQKMLEMEALREEYYGDNGKITILQQEYASITDNLNQTSAEFVWGLYQEDEDNYRKLTEEQKLLINSFKEQGITDYVELHDAVVNADEEMKQNLEKAVNSNMLPTWTTAAQTMAKSWNADDGESVKAQVQNAFVEMNTALDNYDKGIVELEQNTGKSFGEDGIKGDIDKVTISIDNLKNATSTLCSESIEILGGYKAAVNEIETAWNNVYEAMVAALGKSQEVANAPIIQKPNETIGGITAHPGEEDTQNEGDYTPPPEYTPPKEVDVKGFMFDEVVLYVSPGGGRKYSASGSFTGTYNESYAKGGYYPYYLKFSDGKEGYVSKETYEKYIKRNSMTSGGGGGGGRINATMVKMDTGGYTGEWGADGRVAMLHQKELVLNASDTENMLETVKMVRDIANLTSSVGSSVMGGVKALMLEMMGMKAPGGNMTMTPQVADGNNVFNITAEFPNADSVATIQEAILSLPNLASQYLAENRK